MHLSYFESLMNLHTQPSVSVDKASLWIEFPGEYFDPEFEQVSLEFKRVHEVTDNVDFPAPFAPTMAIRESKPTSMFTFLRMIFLVV